MFKVEGYVWTILDIIGIVLLIAGTLGVIDIISAGMNASITLMVLGILLIVISAVFIQMEGMGLRKEHDEYQRFDEIREEARQVPNDLDEGYIIDYTAEPACAIIYDSSMLAKGPVIEYNNEDVYVESPVQEDVYVESPVLKDTSDEDESDVLIVYSDSVL